MNAQYVIVIIAFYFFSFIYEYTHLHHTYLRWQKDCLTQARLGSEEVVVP